MAFARPRAGVTAGLVGAVAVTVLSACATPQRSTPEGDQPSNASGPATQTPDRSAGGEHTVEAPGTFDGQQYGDDLLVVSDETISEEMLEQITSIKVRGKKAVVAHERLAYGQFSVENQVFNIAAVDPAEYRRFTGDRSATFQDQWDRIAGGEIAVDQDLQEQVPVDDDGYVQVGKQRIHLGAWSPAAVDSVDAMVNKKWGETLGLPEDNAVIINTGLASPQVVRERIEKALGQGAVSITALDIVQQAGIDLDTYQNVIPVGAFSDAVGVFRYTPIGGGRIAPDPAWVKKYIVTETVPILGRVTCNRYMMPQFKAALAEIQRTGLADKINPGEYAGCYYPRFIAGSTTLSNHSFGLAFDINVPGNQRGTVGELDRGVVAIFKRWGFAWGGDWSWTDPMHFELERIVSPG
ncbi:M15 family metallopeptidase [Nocardioides sp. SYSU DS0651]|uniref:M15 family metallopeptidase n=1 Tax=Nocardioides sp. SYSU DS0651 TaxID=3415955 RepID=UPI003F4C400C